MAAKRESGCTPFRRKPQFYRLSFGLSSFSRIEAGEQERKNC
jgi:hypothetical protein